MSSNSQPRRYSYTVYVDDNFNYMDESKRYEWKTFQDSETAINECKKIVDQWLDEYWTKEITWEQLYEGYVGFGEDPFIMTEDEECDFSAWDYAKQRCQELCRMDSPSV